MKNITKEKILKIWLNIYNNNFLILFYIYIFFNKIQLSLIKKYIKVYLLFKSLNSIKKVNKYLDDTLY